MRVPRFWLICCYLLACTDKSNLKDADSPLNVYKIERLLLSELITNNAQIVYSFYSLTESYEAYPEL